MMTPLPCEIRRVDRIVRVVARVLVPAHHRVHAEEPPQDGYILPGTHLDRGDPTHIHIRLLMRTLPPIRGPRCGRVCRDLTISRRSTDRAGDQVDRIPKRVIHRTLCGRYKVAGADEPLSHS